MNAFNGIIYENQKVENNPSVYQWMSKQNVVHLQRAMQRDLLWPHREQRTDTCYTRDGPWKQKVT